MKMKIEIANLSEVLVPPVPGYLPALRVTSKDTCSIELGRQRHDVVQNNEIGRAHV